MKLIKPAHYQRNGFDLLDFFELIMPRSWVRGFYILNIIKYLFRFPHKNGKEDILKAGTYMDRFIKYEGADDETDTASAKD